MISTKENTWDREKQRYVPDDQVYSGTTNPEHKTAMGEGSTVTPVTLLTGMPARNAETENVNSVTNLKKMAKLLRPHALESAHRYIGRSSGASAWRNGRRAQRQR